MLKSKENRYNDAVERNIWNAEKYSKAKYVGKILAEAKRKLGIRANDYRHDEAVEKLIAKTETK